jgi:hypothetical protein
MLMWTLSNVKVMPDRLGGEGAENKYIQKFGNFTMHAQAAKAKGAISEIIEARAALFLRFRGRDSILIFEHVSFLRPWHL